MKRAIQFTDRAWGDVLAIYEYIAMNDSEGRADRVFSGLETLCLGLDMMADRGHVPPELAGRVRSNIRELRFKPYRIIYSVQKSQVDVLAVFDGRRDAQSLLEQRVLRN